MMSCRNPCGYLLAVLLTCPFMLLFTGCASAPKTTSMSDPTVDLRAYRTFNFVQYDQTPDQSYETLELTYLRRAARRQMESRGFTYSDQPDMVINFAIDTQEKIQSRTVPRTGYGMGYDPFYDVYYDDWYVSHETRIDQYTEGHLDIDLIDVSERKLIWQGSTRGRLSKKDFEDVQGTLVGAVNEIFTEFPVPAG